MKKSILISFMILLTLFLTGCGGSSQSDTEESFICTMKVEGTTYKIESVYTINYTGKYVDNVHTIETISSDSEDILKQSSDRIDGLYKEASEIYGGYDYTIKKSEGKIVVDTTINYKELNLSKFVEDQPALKFYTDDDKILVDGIKAIYVMMGAKCE